MAVLMPHFARMIALTMLCLAGLMHASQADEGIQLAEQKIKAGLLYNFLKYTEWPAGTTANADAPVTLCLFGDDPIEEDMQAMVGRSVNRHEIAIRKVADAKTEGCFLIFVTAAQKENWPQLRDSLAGQHILTVSDIPGFIGAGGMIEFGLRESHVEVTLNLQAVNRAHLHVQDRLLGLVTVTGKGR